MADQNKKSFNMVLFKKNTISITGSIHGVQLTHDQFLDEFVDWIESKNWSFNGMTEIVTDREAHDRLISQIEKEKEKEDEEK